MEWCVYLFACNRSNFTSMHTDQVFVNIPKPFFGPPNVCLIYSWLRKWLVFHLSVLNGNIFCVRKYGHLSCGSYFPSKNIINHMVHTRIYLAGIFPFWIGLINLWHKIPGYAWFLIYSSFFCFFFLKFDLWVAKCSHGIRTFSSQINYGVQEGICILFTRISFLCLYDNMEQLIKKKKKMIIWNPRNASLYIWSLHP